MGRNHGLLEDTCVCLKLLPRRYYISQILFGILYFVLMVTAAYVLIRMYRNKPAYQDVDKVIEKRGGTK